MLLCMPGYTCAVNVLKTVKIKKNRVNYKNTIVWYQLSDLLTLRQQYNIILLSYVTN